MNHRRLEDLLERVFILELRVGVALGVFMVDTSDFREVFILGTIPEGS